tara:strand:+ start:612 stop:1205 length:594 start_codon:yes stop_codon:yes gene_type:complete
VQAQIPERIRDIVPSKDQTKGWRKAANFYVNGKKNECENYQREKMQKMLNGKIKKTNMRFNKENNEFKDMSNPNTRNDGFEWTEDMDGVYTHLDLDTKFYINFKMVCDKGGAQTRTLREVYDFIKAQCEWLLENSEEDVMFINILDGDESFRNKNKFEYLKNKYKSKKFEGIKDRIFIGDLYEFEETICAPGLSLTQ